MYDMHNTTRTLTNTHILQGVERWLRMVGLERYVNLFARHRLDDYFSLLFLRKQVLELMGLNPAEEGSEAAHLMQCINKWLQLSEPECTTSPSFSLAFKNNLSFFVSSCGTVGGGAGVPSIRETIHRGRSNPGHHMYSN